MVDTAPKELIWIVRDFVKNLFRNEVAVEENMLDNGERRQAAMEISSMVTKLCALQWVRKRFIARIEKRFRTYVKDTPGTGSDSYGGKFLDDGLIEILGVRTEKYEGFEEVHIAEQ